MKALAVLLLGAACSSTAANGASTGPGTPGSGAAVVTATTCDGVRPHVEELYRADAQATEPDRVAEAVADNTTMAMNDCAKDPAARVPCLARAASVGELEKQCLIPLDDEGTEGEALAP